MKSVIKSMLLWIPDSIYLSVRYIYRFRKFPNFQSPARFNENIVSLMLSDSEFTTRRIFADKIEANEYIKDKIGSDYVTPVIEILDNSNLDGFSLTRLPTKFVAKTSHASSFVKVVTNKNNESDQEFKRLFKEWMKVDFYEFCRERVYKNLPKRIIIEEFLEDRVTKGVPRDYKVFVFGGNSKMIQVDLTRFEGHKRVLMDPSWSPYPCRLKQLYPDDLPEKPERLTEMLQLAEKLAEPVSFARVDFYETGDRLIVGEVTNYPGSGNEKFIPDEWDYEFGKCFSDPRYIPKKSL